MKCIEITVSPQGETHIETKGFAGSSCQVASQFLEQALGRQLSETLTGEFFALINAEQKNQQRS